MSKPRASRNNIIAGIFVLASVLLAVAVTIILSNIGEVFTRMTEYTVRFTVAQGADGLAEGAPVKIGGQRVGRVVSTGFVFHPVSGEPEFVDAVIEIPSRFKLYSDAQVHLVRPLLGSGSSINIISVTGGSFATGGATHGPPKLLTAGDIIPGGQGPPAFLSPADYDKFQAILTRVDDITADVQPRVKVIMDEATAAVTDVRDITDDLRKRWAVWGPKADTIVDNAEAFSTRFADLGTSLEARADQVKSLLTSAQSVINDNRAPIDEAIQNIRDLTAKAKGEGYDKFMAALEEAKQGIAAARNAAQEADRLIASAGPDISDIVTNLALAANQTKLATVEVRAAPWRLLYQPTKKELENELLYNSARQYSQAVTELRLAAGSLQSLASLSAQSPSTGTAVSPAAIDDMAEKLRTAFAQYKEQERLFFDRWVQEAK